MKIFDDLIFEPHIGAPYFSEQARLTFDNGYGISVITGESVYGNKQRPYECAVIGLEGEITYNTSVTSDVVGFCTKEDVTEVMLKIQNLKDE